MILNVSKYCTILLFFPLCLFAQTNIQEQFAYANNLFENEKYFDAITEYKRLLFFDKDKEYTYAANLRIASSYKEGAKFSEAIKYFSISEGKAASVQEEYDSKIEIIRCNILRGSTGQAIILLNKLETDKRFKDKLEEIIYWRGWAYIFADDWEKASNEFNRISAEHPLRKLSLQVQEEKYSVSFAKVISYIIPGAGQIYTGYMLSGFMSLGWNALFIYLGVNSFNADRILDGLIYTGLFFRFHRGNVQNAEKFAIDKNIDVSNRALLYLKNQYSGLKP